MCWLWMRNAKDSDMYTSYANPDHPNPNDSLTEVVDWQGVSRWIKVMSNLK